MHDVVAKRASITARLQQVASMLDDVANKCQQLSADIGSSRDAAAALLELSQVCVNAKQHFHFLLFYFCWFVTAAYSSGLHYFCMLGSISNEYLRQVTNVDLMT